MDVFSDRMGRRGVKSSMCGVSGELEVKVG